MGRKRTPLKREYKGEITINIRAIFRNPDIQDNVIKEVKKIAKRRVSNCTVK